MFESSTNHPASDVEEFTGVSLQYKSPAQFLQQSLDFHLVSLNSLCVEMDAYKGPTEEEILRIRSEVQRWMSNSSLIWSRPLSDVLDEQVALHSEPSAFFSTKFSQPFMTHAVPMIILACALGEAMINGLVATGLSLKKNEKLFEMFDRLDLRQKWILGPELICDGCKIDQGNSLFERLKALISIRNSLMHGKPTIRIDNDLASFRGKDVAIELSSKCGKEIASMSQLPHDLFEYVMASMPEGNLKFYLGVSRMTGSSGSQFSKQT